MLSHDPLGVHTTGAPQRKTSAVTTICGNWCDLSKCSSGSGALNGTKVLEQDYMGTIGTLRGCYEDPIMTLSRKCRFKKVSRRGGPKVYTLESTKR